MLSIFVTVPVYAQTASPVVDYHLDSCFFDTATPQVIDSANGFNLTPENDVSVDSSGELCNAAYFDADKGSKIQGNADISFDNQLTMMAWFKSTGGIKPYARIVEFSDSQGDYQNGSAIAFDINGTTIRAWTTSGGFNHRTPEVSYNLKDNGYLDGKWHHVTFVYDGANVYLYIDGVLKDSKTNANIKDIYDAKTLVIGGYYPDNEHSFNGSIDEVKIFKTALTKQEINRIISYEASGRNYDGSKRVCQACSIIADYHMDSCSWNGNIAEVIDSSRNRYNATAEDGATTGEGKLCRGGLFNGSDYVLLPSNFPHITGSRTILAWIYTTNNNTAQGQRIFADDEYNTSGHYALSLCDPGTGRIRFYIRGLKPISLDSKAVVENNRWYFVAATYDNTTQTKRLYIFDDSGNLLDSVSQKVTGSIQKPNGPVTIGGESDTSSESNRKFRGRLDEIQIYSQALSKAQIEQIYTNELNGLNYDGTTRTCPVCCNVTYSGTITPIEFEGGEVTLKDTYKDPTWTHITFKKPFSSVPVVFMVTDTIGPNPSSVRIKNVTTTGFDASLVEPEPEDGPHIAQTLDYFAINRGVHRLGNHYIEVGTVNTRKVQGKFAPAGNDVGWEFVPSKVGFCNPVVVANIQTLNNLSSNSNPPKTPLIPWGTAVIDNITSNGFNLAIDMSETNEGVFSKDETIGYMIAEANITDSFTDNSGKLIEYETIKTDPYFVGWDDTCRRVRFYNNYTKKPLIAGWKDSRIGTDGGWFRKCYHSTTEVGFVVDEDRAYDYERHHVPEMGGIFAFSDEFVLTKKVDHYEIIHGSDALTCQPAEVTVKACADESCSELYADNVTVTMSPTGWIGGDTHTFDNGSSVLKLSHTTPGTVTLGISSSEPYADYCCRNPAVDDLCVKDSAHCDMTFHDSGFIFDVTNQTSCKPSQSIEIKAVRKDDTTQLCVPAFADVEKSVDFWFKYQTPDTGAEKLKIKGNAESDFKEIGASSSDKTAVKLNFDSNGTATFQVEYPDAGRLNLYAEYDNTSSGLVMKGEDVYGGPGNGFVVKPWAFYIDIPDNPAARDAEGGVFTKAGENFSLTVKAVCWQANDNISNNSDLKDNPVTPNFKGNIALSHTLVAPSGGNAGTLGVTSLAATDGEATTDNETYSEVGIIALKAYYADYLGAGSISGNVPFVGRFIPDHFLISSKTDGILKQQCSTFNYTGELTTYQKPPSFVITAKNKDNITTLNYKSLFFKLTADGITITSPTTDDKQLGADGTNRVKLQIDRAAPTLKDNDNGTGTYTFGYDNVTYIRDNNSKIAPFSPKFTFVIDNITDSDGVEAVGLKDNVSVEGLSMKYGRLKIFDNYGPETEDLEMSVEAQFWDGNYWKINDDDSCSTLIKSDFNLSDFTGNLSEGETEIIDSSVYGVESGRGGFTLSAPGEGNYGTVKICISPSARFYGYLNDPYSCATATFGIYRGRDRIIEWREIPAQ